MESKENIGHPKRFRLTTLKSNFIDTLKLVLKLWYIPLLSVALLTAVLVYLAKTAEPSYNAKISFILNDEGGSPGINVGNILSSFGIPSGKPGGANLEKIVELIKSRRILKGALLKKAALYDNQEDYLANYFIDIYELNKDWKKKEQKDLIDFRFARDSFTVDDYIPNGVLNSIVRSVKGMLTAVSTTGENMNLTISSKNEEFSLELCNAIYYELLNYYKETQTKKSRETFELLEFRTDSLRNALAVAESKLARFSDTNRGLFANVKIVESDKLQRDITVLTGIYIESARNLETARFNLKNAEPAFRTIDEPVYPLAYKKPKLSTAIINGVILGLVCGLIIVLGMRYVNNRIKQEEELDRREAELL